ncbi:MAG: hypothetical protein AVDCRST_MAG20-686 [uncultured Acidimicrobiales bacterium]|uniref:Uncharacterized protein n=1 Tax=uncultured Acidimicrobiales bacterium TaxID=310071 RepID=A0A6J4HBT8_9ACTN|nr:MAG: hypothetical protein AVDCRST_MAG20-686 [uncultured Acidimicrobiales bacterium]
MGVVGDGRRLVTVVEQQAPVPRAEALDLRSEALWLDLVCEAPLEHWSVGLEAFGVALDEPGDAFRGLRGDRIGVGLDLGWESSGEAVALGTQGYELACEVHGEVLLGDEVLTFDGWGSRRHTWGVNDWRAGASSFGAGQLDDGSRWAVSVPVPGGATSHPVGAWVRDDGAGRADGLPGVVTVGFDGQELVNEVRHLSPVPLDDGGRSARAVHALCHSTTGDGRAGAAWVVLVRPGS